MFLLDIIARSRFRNLLAYRSYDKVVEQHMNEAIINCFRRAVEGGEKEDLVKEVFDYRTRLYEAGTVETLAIWAGNRGAKDALTSAHALELATTFRLAFGEGDIIDTYNDEYGADVIPLLDLSDEEYSARASKSVVLARMIRLLDELIFNRFLKLHTNTDALYRSYRKKVEDGQAEDVQLHLRYLTGDLSGVRGAYSSMEDVVELLVRKLGVMGECVARVAYRESGGEDQEVEDALAQFYLNAGVLLQFWGNDVHKLWSDLERRDTNPIITYAIIKHPETKSLEKGLLRRVLLENPRLLDEMMLPYHDGMERNLRLIDAFRFDAVTHKGLALMVKRAAKKEKARLFRAL